jgi:hypothetical protein
MSTSASQATKVTKETKIAKAFGLDGENWMRHANPVSVWTRFAVLPLLAAAIWSRDWIGWWCLLFEDMKGRYPQYAAWEY